MGDEVTYSTMYTYEDIETHLMKEFKNKRLQKIPEDLFSKGEYLTDPKSRVTLLRLFHIRQAKICDALLSNTTPSTMVSFEEEGFHRLRKVLNNYSKSIGGT